jgi:predicted dehydrogenase
MVGFNRRFAPQVQRTHGLLRAVSGPKSFVMTVNSGAIPADHWTQDRMVGGGRIVGEGCHFIDLLRFLAGAEIGSVATSAMDSRTADTVTIALSFRDGSIGSGRVLQLDNFRRLHGFGWPAFRKMNLWRQDKGQGACARAFVDAVSGRSPPPIAFEELIEVARASIDAADFSRIRG